MRRGAPRAVGSEFDAVADLLAALPPERVARADRAIADAAGLHRRPPASALARLLRRPVGDHERLRRTPGLATPFLFHRDGRLREAALRSLSGGLASPFPFAAVAWRLNDWAAPVRAAAADCAARCFPATRPDVVARCAATLLVPRLSWTRWRAERDALDRAFARPDVAACLADLLAAQPTGPAGRVLRAALRMPALDPHLPRLAREAVQPAARAAALTALLDGRASWPSGHAWVWVDKSMGRRRRVAIRDGRDLTVGVERDLLIGLGLRDRAPAVRRVALDAVIRDGADLAGARARVAQLLMDPSPSVRERAAFIMRRSAL